MWNPTEQLVTVAKLQVEFSVVGRVVARESLQASDDVFSTTTHLPRVVPKTSSSQITQIAQIITQCSIEVQGCVILLPVAVEARSHRSSHSAP